MTTQAVHVELACDMSTDSFILALCRFKARKDMLKIFKVITERILLMPKENSKMLYQNLAKRKL